VVTVVALATLAGCGSGGGKKNAGESFATAPSTTFAAGAPGSVATAPTTTPAASRQPDLSLNSFKAPSGNIGCHLESGLARCDIREHSFAPPPKPANCDLDWGSAVQVSGGPSGFVCAGDTVFDPAATALAYGQRARQGSVVCESAEVGLTCTEEAGGHGFFLSRERYRLF